MRLGLSLVVSLWSVGAAAQDGGPEVATRAFSPEAVRDVVRAHQPQIQACYEAHLASKRQAPQGQIVAHFVITVDGLVKQAKLTKVPPALRNAQLRDCMVAVLSAMEFPKPPGGKAQPIDFPFNLKIER